MRLSQALLNEQPDKAAAENPQAAATEDDDQVLTQDQKDQNKYIKARDASPNADGQANKDDLTLLDPKVFDKMNEEEKEEFIKNQLAQILDDDNNYA